MGGHAALGEVAIGVAVGAEYRQEELVFRTISAWRPATTPARADRSPPVTGRYNVSEVYGEVRVPLIQDQELFEDLSLNGGYRYSSYSNAGAVNTYKYGAEWQPVDDIRFRGSFQRAVRAPNILELFTPVHTGLYQRSRPVLRFGPHLLATGSAPAQCARTGVSLANTMPAAPACRRRLVESRPARRAQCNEAGRRQSDPEAGSLRYEIVRHRC